MSTDTPIRLEINYTFDDLVGHRRGPLEQRIRWSWHQLLLWAALAAGAWIFFVLFRGPPPGGRPRAQSTADLLSPVAIAVGIFIIFLSYRALMKRRARRKWNVRQIPLIHLTLGPDGLLWESSGTRQAQSWNALRSASESPKAFLIEPLEGPELVIPKRVMTDDQVASIRQLLQDRITGHRGFPIIASAPAGQSPPEQSKGMADA